MAMNNSLDSEQPEPRAGSTTLPVWLVLCLCGCAAALAIGLARKGHARTRIGEPPLSASGKTPPCSTCGRWSSEFTPDPLDSPDLQSISRQIYEVAVTAEDWTLHDLSWLAAIVENPQEVVPDLSSSEGDRASALALRAFAKRLRDNVPDDSWTPVATEYVGHWLGSPRDVVRYGALLVYFDAQHAKVDPAVLAELKAAPDALIASTARAIERAP